MSDVIYLLSSGEYSDYSVHCAYLTKEEAEAARDALNEAEDSNGCCVEEVPLAPQLPKFKDGFAWWLVRFKGGEWSADPSHSTYRIRNDSGVTKYIPYDGKDHYIVSVVSDTEERALKAGMERIMQFIATNP